MKTSLLVMDVQPGILERLPDPKIYQQELTKTVNAARFASVPVIFVVVGFRPGFPEVGPNNKSFSAIAAGNSKMIEPAPAIKPEAGEPVVTKRRVSAYSGSDLEVILRAQNIDHLVLTGIATSGVVLSTLRQAADMDFKLTVIEDLCADFDDQVHKFLIEKIFPRQADVVTSAKWQVDLKKRTA
jgi:nicotinamidase-related amidase